MAAWETAVLAYVADRTRVTLRDILVHQFGWTQPHQQTMRRYKRIAACLRRHGWQRTRYHAHGHRVKGFVRTPLPPACTPFQSTCTPFQTASFPLQPRARSQPSTCTPFRVTSTRSGVTSTRSGVTCTTFQLTCTPLRLPYTPLQLPCTPLRLRLTRVGGIICFKQIVPPSPFLRPLLMRSDAFSL